MDRYLSSKGFTLLELIMTVAIGAIVLISATDLLINFANYSSNMVKAESSLMDTALGAFEDIVYNIRRANKTALGSETAISVPNTPFPVSNPTSCAANNTCIQVRADTDAAIKTPSDYSDDSVYTYWLSGGVMYRAIGAGAGVVIARNLTTLTFSRSGAAQNDIRIVFEAQNQSGAVGGVVKERLETTVVLLSRGV